jgi:hypothetical protein
MFLGCTSDKTNSNSTEIDISNKNDTATKLYVFDSGRLI